MKIITTNIRIAWISGSVAVQERARGETAEAGQGEDGLHDHGPAHQRAEAKPTTVTVGIKAFRSACRSTIARRLMPLAWAVRM